MSSLLRKDLLILSRSRLLVTLLVAYPVVIALLIGLQLYGVVGALVALPVAAVLRETAVYLNRHLVLEPWERSPGRLL